MSKTNCDILKYLTNPIYQSNNNNITNNNISDEDKEFYRKRVLLIGKEIYSGIRYDNTLNKAYEDFIYLAINHCKITDTKDIIQEQYDMFTTVDNKVNNKTNNTIDISFNINKTNDIVFNSKTVNNTNLDTFLNIKKPAVQDNFIPQQKNINLKTSKLKKKGLKEKKSKKDKKDKIS
tara:strand:- start:2586 stop:3116 length:531 start_codon:yes stop_codon:yes gene_type:complete